MIYLTELFRRENQSGFKIEEENVGSLYRYYSCEKSHYRMFYWGATRKCRMVYHHFFNELSVITISMLVSKSQLFQANVKLFGLHTTR